MNSLVIEASIAGCGERGIGCQPMGHRSKADAAIPAATTVLFRIFLAAFRSAAFLFFSLVALAEITIAIPFVAREQRLAARAAWLHAWSRFACKVLGIEVNVHGTPPRNGLLASNHLSYVDILALSAIAPCVFVAKSDVRQWPLFGWLAASAGAVFADRRKSTDAPRTNELIREVLQSDVLVVLFPEGTSSDGSTVLPFKSALLEPAVELGANVTAGAIDYALPNGSVADEICYWRDMTLVPHLLNLFTKPRIQAQIAFADVKYRTRDRKVVAYQLRKRILEMRS